MTIVRDVPPVWSATITTTVDTLFQVQAGAIYLDIGGAATEADDGLFLVQDPVRPLRDSVVIPAGVTLRWKRAGGREAKLYYADLA